MPQPGFMIYADDWSGILEDYDVEEVGALFSAILRFFNTGETTDFDDRGMRQFYRQQLKTLDLDRAKYMDKCRTNAYNRYRRTCKEKKEKPLSFDEWVTNLYDRKPP